MTRPNPTLLNARQLAALELLLHQGSSAASTALVRWIGRPSVVEIISLDQLPLEAATRLIGGGDEPVCFCSVEIQGNLTGEMILVFDDGSGLALADMVLQQPPGTTKEWTAMARSAAEETTNILCCAYLGSLSGRLGGLGHSHEILPTPPKFRRDFAECLMQFALMGQAVASDQVLLARTSFEIEANPVHWTLLFVPDAASKSQLAAYLSDGVSER